MPKPGEAHARLHALVGRWEGGETLHPAPWDPAGGPATAVVENRVALNGFAVIQEYLQTRQGAPSFAGHAVFWWDQAAGQHVMTWFDAMSGTPTEYRGGFDGDVLRLSHTIPQGGFSRCSFDCGTAGRYLFRLETSRDGVSWAPALEGTYRRVRPAAARPPVLRPAARKAGPAKATTAAAGKRAVAKVAIRVRAKGPAPTRGVAAARSAGKRGGRGGRRR